MNRAYMLARAVRGPLMLIALGVLLTLHRFQDIRFSKTWPALLILLGVMKLVERAALRAGQNSSPTAGNPL